MENFSHVKITSFRKVYLSSIVGSTHKDKTSMECFIHICADIGDPRILGVLINAIERSPLAEAVKVRSSVR